MKPGDFVYIEATTGNGRNDSEWTIKGIYEIYKITRTRIWLSEECDIIKIYKSRITKIEVKPNNLPMD